MLIHFNCTYHGGSLLVTNVPAAEGLENKMTSEAEALIDRYIRLLNENKILGEIDVSFVDVQKKFSS